MVMVTYYNIYYCVIVAWSLYYFVASFVSIPDLPWSTCGKFVAINSFLKVKYLELRYWHRRCSLPYKKLLLPMLVMLPYCSEVHLSRFVFICGCGCVKPLCKDLCTLLDDTFFFAFHRSHCCSSNLTWNEYWNHVITATSKFLELWLCGPST